MIYYGSYDILFITPTTFHCATLAKKEVVKAQYTTQLLLRQPLAATRNRMCQASECLAHATLCGHFVRHTTLQIFGQLAMSCN